MTPGMIPLMPPPSILRIVIRLLDFGGGGARKLDSMDIS